MFTRATVLAVAGCSLASGCGVERDAAEEREEIVANLIEAGYPEGQIMVVEGAVYVGRDARVTLEASREMLEAGGSQEQYRTTNLVSRTLRRICVNGSTFTGVFSTALDMALANYTQLALTFDMVRGPTTGCDATINAVIQPGLVGGTAGFPSGGKPFYQITIGGGLSTYSVDTIEHVITHELGHTIGFRHSDFFHQVTCSPPGSEGAGGVGAIHIPGTPTTATVGGSVMNSCFRTYEPGELTSSDVTALLYLY